MTVLEVNNIHKRFGKTDVLKGIDFKIEEGEVVSVIGSSGSGKTTLTEHLVSRFGDDIAVVHHDNYYKRHDDLTYEERTKLNYDHPDSFETDMMVKHVRMLKKGIPVEVPIYDYSIHNRSQATTLVEPKKVVIVEGILILENKELRDEMDLKIFVDTDADERLMRRIKRDTVERARTVESILSQYQDTVKPMHEAYIEPSKKYADIIIPRGGQNTSAIELLLSHIDSLLKID